MSNEQATGEGKSYLVKAGDDLHSIADRHGFFWETIWELPENQELKDLRGDPSVLCAGDHVFLPDKRQRDEEAATDKKHKFRRKGVPARFVLRFALSDGPRADAAYTLIIDGRAQTGVTDSDGRIDVAISPRARNAEVVFRDGDREERHQFRIGALDPFDSIPGVRERLRNLGYEVGAEEPTLDPATELALRQFQADQGLDETGTADPETCERVRTLHGS